MIHRRIVIIIIIITVIVPLSSRSFARAAKKKLILTPQQVIYWTNVMRKNNGVAVLSENDLLDKAAQQKVKDMFARQYFAHVSPIGLGADNLVKSTGYDAIASGENLAYGMYKTEKELVDGWMKSPGHRANMLHGHYREIGVAIAQGRYNGVVVWMAVQEFGLSHATCPDPRPTLKSTIEKSQHRLTVLETKIVEYKTQINTFHPDSEESTATVGEYNALVEEYNTIVKELQPVEKQYNMEIHRYNTCIQ